MSENDQYAAVMKQRLGYGRRQSRSHNKCRENNQSNEVTRFILVVFVSMHRGAPQTHSKIFFVSGSAVSIVE